MTFSEVKSLFEQVKARNPEAANMTLEQFAQMGAQYTGDPEMVRIGQANPWENILRTANQKLNEGIAAITPDETLGKAVGGLAEMVGVDRATGEAVGKSLPRQVVNVAAMGIPVVGPALSFGLSAADTYDQTGSMWQTAIAGAAPMVVSKAMNVGGNAVLQAAAKSPTMQRLGVTGGREVVREITEDAGRFLPTGTITTDLVIDQLPDKLVRYAGAQAAGQATGLGLDIAAQGTDAVFNKDYLFANLVGNLAFAPLDVGDFIGNKTIETRKLQLPPEAVPIRTSSEQRAFEFESLLSSLSPLEQQRAQRRAGFDIAAQLLGERRLTELNQDFDNQMSKERALLESDWEGLKEVEPAIAGLQLDEVILKPEVLNSLTPGAKERVERFQEKVKELEGVKRVRMDALKSVGGTQDVLGVTIDELRLPEVLLNKSAEERVFEDYKAALDGKVSDRGQQVLFAMHKLAAGKRDELMSGPHKEIAEEVEKVLNGEGTKFAGDRSFVSMALWATGRKPKSDVEYKKKVEKKMKEGKTTKEAVVEVNQEELVKVEGALRQEEMLKQLEPGKKRGRPEGLAKATIERIEKSETRIQNGLQSGDAAQRDFYVKVQAAISEIDDADANVNAKLMAEVDKQLSMTVDKGVPLDRALEMLKLKLGQVKVAFIKDQVAKGKVGEQSQALVDVAVETKSPVSEDLDQLIYLRDQLGLEELSSDTVNEAALRLLERGMTPKIAQAIKDNLDLPIVQDLLRVINELRVPALFNEKGMLKVQYTEFINFMHEMMKKESPQLKKEAVIFELKEMNVATQNKAWLIYQQWKKEGKPAVKDVVGFKFARSEGANSDFAVHSLMSLDQWSDTLLRGEGFSPEEAKELREHFAAVTEMFYSPEVRYGKLGEVSGEMKFARAAAGGGFDFGMAEYKDGKLLRPGKGAVTPRKDGTLGLQEFKVAGGQFGMLSDGEIEFYKQLVPAAFDGDRVNVKVLWEGLQNASESVQVVTYGQRKEKDDPDKSRFDELTHEWFDDLTSHEQSLIQEYINSGKIDPGMQYLDMDIVNEYAGLKKKLGNYKPDLAATSFYNQISPFDTKKFPVMRVDVVLKNKLGENPQFVQQEQAALQELKSRNYSPIRDQEGKIVKLKDTISGQEIELNKLSSAVYGIVKDANEANSLKGRFKGKEFTLWEQDNTHENLPNTLGWAMVQTVPDPKTGEPVMFVGELQSRWAQELRPFEKIRSSLKEDTEAPPAINPRDKRWKYTDAKGNTRSVTARSKEEAFRAIERTFGFKPEEHPLLPIHQNLILKSVIREAQKRGINKIAISDAETAMMTEKHDQKVYVHPDELEKMADEFEAAGKGTVTTRGQDVYFWSKDDKINPLATLHQTSLGYEIESNPGNLLFQPSQAGGMRLAYDTTLPSLMKKLVGDGQMEDFGVHKNAKQIKLPSSGSEHEAQLAANSIALREGRMTRAEWFAARDELEKGQFGSPIFRNPVQPNTNVEFKDQFGNKALLTKNTRPGEDKWRVSYIDNLGEPHQHHTYATWEDAMSGAKTDYSFGDTSEMKQITIGTPKSNVTARVYSILSPSERLSSLFARSNISQTYAAAATRTRDIFFSPTALKGRNAILQQASLLAHEHSHILFSKARSGAFGSEAQRLVNDFEVWAKTLNPHEAETFVDVLGDVWLGSEWKKLPGVEDVLKNVRNEKGDVDVEEVMANVFGAYAAGLSKPSNPTKFYTMMPRVVRDVFDWVARMVQGVVGAARMYGKFGGDVKKVRQAGEVKKVFDAVRRGARNAERNLADLAELANLRGSDVVDKVDVMFAKGRYGSSGKWREKLSYLFDNTVMRMGSLAATYDGLQEPFVAMKDFSPLNADLTAQVFASLGMGKYSHTGLSVEKDGSWMRIRNSPELHKLASQVNVEMQMLRRSVVRKEEDGTLVFDMKEMTPELRGRLQQFSPEAQQAVAEYFVKRAEFANPIVHGTIVGKEWDKQATVLHEMLFESKYAEFGGKYEESKGWSERVMKMARQGDDQGVMSELGRIVDPTARAQIAGYVEAVVAKVRGLQEEYAKNPNFGSLRRFQPIKVKWIKAGDVRNMQANTAAEAERQDAELRKDGWTPQSVRIVDFKPKSAEVFDSNTKLRVRDMEERVKLALKEMAVPEELKAELEREIDFVGMIERTENAQSVFSTKAQRRFAEGVDDLMVLEQDMLWMSKAIYAANRNALDAKVRVALKNPKLDEYLDAKRTFAQGYENFKTQNHDWLRKLSKANAAYFIGFNLPGHVAELMQPVMTHLAEMRYVGVKTNEALRIMLGASKDLVGFYKRNMKKFVKGEEVHLWDDWKDKDEKDMLFRMKHVINANPLNYAFEDAGFQQQKLIEAAELGKKQGLMNAIASPASAYANWGLKFYGLFTRHNAIMGLLNGYRAYRKMGVSHEEAVQKVGLFEAVVNKSGGKADRQAFPFKNNAVLGHLFYGLQGYTTGWISQLATYYRHGYKSDGYEGFKGKPEAVKKARAAFKTMLLAQLGAAGVMGMPFAGAIVTLLEELTGDDIRGEMYEALDAVTGDPLLSQAASHGLSTAMAERLGIPADLHGRFAIGGLLGFNAYDGFSASSLLGPTAGMINSMWNLGKTYAQERDVQKALEAGGPTGLRSIAKALDEELPLRNESALSTALGFNTTQTRKEKEFNRIATNRNEKAARDISHAARRVQDALSKGNSVAQQVLRAEAMKLADDPEELSDMVRKIGNKVKLFEEQRVLPKDIREVATPETAVGLSKVARAMGVKLPPSQEFERETLKNQIAMKLGMSPAQRYREANLRDYQAELDPWNLR